MVGLITQNSFCFSFVEDVHNEKKWCNVNNVPYFSLGMIMNENNTFVTFLFEHQNFICAVFLFISVLNIINLMKRYDPAPQVDSKEIVVVVAILVIGALTLMYTYKDIFINPTPTPKIGLDQDLMQFISEWVKDNEFLIRDLCDLRNRPNLNIPLRVESFQHIYLTRIANRPEAEHALDLLNKTWDTNFANFADLFKIMHGLKG